MYYTRLFQIVIILEISCIFLLIEIVSLARTYLLSLSVIYLLTSFVLCNQIYDLIYLHKLETLLYLMLYSLVYFISAFQYLSTYLVFVCYICLVFFLHSVLCFILILFHKHLLFFFISILNLGCLYFKLYFSILRVFINFY